MLIGQRVREARTAAGMTQPVLAALVGMSQAAISELETGASTTTGYTARLAAALGVVALWIETGRGPRRAVSADSADDSANLALIVAAYRDSTKAGKAKILDASTSAEKLPKDN